MMSRDANMSGCRAISIAQQVWPIIFEAIGVREIAILTPWNPERSILRFPWNLGNDRILGQIDIRSTGLVRAGLLRQVGLRSGDEVATRAFRYSRDNLVGWLGYAHEQHAAQGEGFTLPDDLREIISPHCWHLRRWSPTCALHLVAGNEGERLQVLQDHNIWSVTDSRDNEIWWRGGVTESDAFDYIINTYGTRP